MTPTDASKAYFAQHAADWDELRSGYFPAAVREAAIARAFLRPKMIVADVGAGTGFVSAALAPLVREVYVLDASPEMLAVAQKNLAEWDHIHYFPADGKSLPLLDDSMDAVFANMYLHHCVDPLAAIREMVRILKPGGRLVLTDLDRHDHEWMKAEMADEWLGFERPQLQRWFAEAGLVNVYIADTAERCCAAANGEAANPQAEIQVFVAVGAKRVPMVSQVQTAYSAAAAGKMAVTPLVLPAEPPATCCSPLLTSSCCTPDTPSAGGVRFAVEYDPAELAKAPQDAAELPLGCGNPLAMAGLKPGETVLDIGSGGGLDVFLAAGRVGEQGRVIGVDMTPAMLDRARAAAERAKIGNVEFRQGRAEALPVENEAVDVIISNCVINLCEDKGAVFAEAFRALKPGGRLEVSDMVTSTSFDQEDAEQAGSWAGCISGALPESEYLALVRQAGFGNVTARRSTSAGTYAGAEVYSVIVSARKLLAGESVCGCGCD
jgi:ubiquinone/menaquinone biosynthesis C-methylase UbiE